MNKHVVFISLPMSGVPDTEILQHLKEARKWYLKKTGKPIRDVTFIDNLNTLVPPDGPLYKQGVYYIGRAILKMYTCDEVLFFPGWEKARGCRIEHEICTEYDIPYMHMEDDSNEDDD